MLRPGDAGRRHGALDIDDGGARGGATLSHGHPLGRVLSSSHCGRKQRGLQLENRDWYLELAVLKILVNTTECRLREEDQEELRRPGR